MHEGFHFTIKVNPLEMSFTTASIADAVTVLQKEGTAIAEVFKEATAALATADEGGAAAPAPVANGAAPAADKPARRGRPRNTPDPATASAPPPAPIPGAAPPAPPAPINTAENGAGVPAFLDRTAPPAPAPVAPPPPAPAPVAAPQFVIGNKVADYIKASAGADPKRWVDWVAGTGVLAQGANATIEEVDTVLRFLPDDKAAPLAKALSI